MFFSLFPNSTESLPRVECFPPKASGINLGTEKRDDTYFLKN